MVTGRVSPSLSVMYLKKLLEEQAINKWWKATITRREIRRFGCSNEQFLLLDLEKIEQPRTESLTDANPE